MMPNDTMKAELQQLCKQIENIEHQGEPLMRKDYLMLVLVTIVVPLVMLATLAVLS